MDALKKCGMTTAEALAGAERGAALIRVAMTGSQTTDVDDEPLCAEVHDEDEEQR